VSKSNSVVDFIYSTNYVDGNLPIREVKTWLHTQPSVQSLGVILGEGSFGLITRSHLNQHALNHVNEPAWLEQPVSSVAVPENIVVDASESLSDVVTQLLTQKGKEISGEDYFHDIIVTKKDAFVGLASARDVLLEHIESLMHRMTAVEAQQATLVRKNRELFESSFRQGQTETQFKTIFERAPLPLAVFDHDGRMVSCNVRFLRLSHYQPKQIDKATFFGQFFDEDYVRLRNEQTEIWASSRSNQQSVYTLNMRSRQGERMSTEVAIELLPDFGQLVVAILGLPQEGGRSSRSHTIETHEDAGVEPSITAGQNLVKNSAAKPGRITQAIRTTLASKEAQGLARSVATNLIDREKHLDRMMKKLEAIIEITEQLEQRERAPAEPEESAEPSTRRLSGDLAEFSVIDLCQILIQGTKTGHLKIATENLDDLFGSMYFYCGSIVHAETKDEIRGVDALAQIVSLRKGVFDFSFDVSSPETSIKGDAMGLLMEACQKVDENN